MPVDAPDPGPTVANTDLVLTPPQPVATVSPAQTGSLVPLDPAAIPKLDSLVAAYGASISSLDVHSAEFANKVSAVENLGDKDIRSSASVSNRMLDQPMKASGVLDNSSPIGSSLLDLRRTVNDLDPTKHNLIGEKKLLGLIPFGNRLRDYFQQYQSAQTHINSIMKSLFDGQDELQQDNAAIEQEKVNLWETMQRLQQYSYMASKLDAFFEAKIAEIQATDPAKAKVLNEDVLFYVRQKRQDLLTQLAVSAQGYLALDLVRKNNVELIKGVDRATTTTVAALRTAVIVASALANEKLVLDQITAVNTTTGNLIESTSVLLKQQTESVNEQAASSTVNIDQLKAAFDNIYATMDSIDTYKVQALQTMKTTVDSLEHEVTKAQGYLDRAHDEKPADERISAASSELTLPAGTAG